MISNEHVTVNDAKQAINLFGVEIRFIINPSEEIQLAAVKHDWYAIKYIQNPTPAVRRAAIRKNPWIIFDYIKNPTEEEKRLAVELNPRILTRMFEK